MNDTVLIIEDIIDLLYSNIRYSFDDTDVTLTYSSSTTVMDRASLRFIVTFKDFGFSFHIHIKFLLDRITIKCFVNRLPRVHDVNGFSEK